LLHRLQPTDHGLNARLNLLVLLQQGCAFRGKRILSLFQRPVFSLQLITNIDQRVDALLKTFQFVFKLLLSVFGHRLNIEPGAGRINCAAIGEIGNAWSGWWIHGIIRPAFERAQAQLALQTPQSGMTLSIDLNELDAALERCGAHWRGSQTHGLLCGGLSTFGPDGALVWRDQVLEGLEPGNAQRAECEFLLDELFQQTWRQLAERQSDFELLLPSDAENAADRARALADWCEGFLHGLVSQTHSDDMRARLGAEPLSDIIKDMLEMTRATVGDEEGEAIDAAYVELVEYVRVGVQLAFEELAEVRDSAASAGTLLDTQH